MEAKSTTRLPPRLFSLLGNPLRETQTSPEEVTTKDLTPSHEFNGRRVKNPVIFDL